jgi:release factor glutamine methyltransferase
VTISAPTWLDPTPKTSDVYLPQEDSRLLVETLTRSVGVTGRSVLDICTGSGVVAIAAARLGAKSVAAWDVCPNAVRYSRANAASAKVAIDVRLGSWTRARLRGPFDVVLANPPYVPADPDSRAVVDGPALAWDAGPDGRLVVDPLCAAAPDLLAVGGTLLFVQSELTGVDESLDALSAAGLTASVVARQHIPFGPVLSSRAEWLERTGRIAPGCRTEELVVIRADRW